MLELTRYLHRSGHHSLVAADPRGLLYRRVRDAGFPVSALRVRNDLDLLAGLRLRRLVRAGSHDLVHFHTARAHALSPWLQGLPVKRVVTRRMDYPVKKGPVTRFLYTQSVDTVVAISTGVRSVLLAGAVPAARIRLIPSGIATARFTRDPAVRARVRQAHGFGDHETVVLSVGALVERKGHPTLLAAAHQLKSHGLQLRYLVCGDGALRATLEAKARTLGLAHEVLFAGFCSDVPGALAAADLFVHVPLHEGLGVAVIEALAAGLPVVASQVGGIPELIDGRTTGLLIPAQDSAALAVAVQRLVSDPSWAAHCGRTGQALARARFDVAVMAQANEQLYVELAGSTPRQKRPLG